ncbi:2-desacetyl-2-hydroxyethyl bacteriochlorophyllide A dehydrogenase [Paenibacillus sp. UNCCL117]|uniref:zinc-dependent alcohol dehydrogenase n=1 Tax=unclassified Paenibacillus TaxID=185978 RepID=UPI000890B1A5|nr:MULTISPECIES: alcohol dehydrogenase catalytic domain-containing protein [unclassified Paenibacillus]SDD47770.1 2-desacetyl-2-hydroxyethyl bacteriochlorophyllide A dehydrogenase [Paenibacillus sp. cl123]SFW50376.1 2-desacetyl-2-hydroxyethyl bacteriochlorophyllide A dehydrogenase [Paenibacillus sp. UNCCL117]
MKAAVLTEWQRIELQEVPVPEIGEDECLIEVTYAGVCGSDVHIYKGHHPTAVTPVIPGHEFTGRVAKASTDLYPHLTAGTRVVAEPLISCGECAACLEGHVHVCRRLKLLGIHTDGGFAQYIKVPAAKVIPISDVLSDRAAALAEPFAVAFHVNRQAEVRHGDRVLVVGGGPIGMVVGIVAKQSGAAKVVFTELNEDRLAVIRSFGFEGVNPQTTDVNAYAEQATDGAGFDVVFEVSGSQPGLLSATKLCKIKGTVVLVGFPGRRPELEVMDIIFKELRVVGSRVYTLQDFKKTVRMLEELAVEGRYRLEALVSDTRSLEQLEEAIQTMIRGENTGKILIDYGLAQPE